MRPRVVQTLCGALDSDKPFATKYGALQCLVALGPAALHRYAEPRLTKLAAAFAELPESDDKRRCLDAIVSARRGLRGAAPGSCFQEQTAGTYVEGEWRAVGEVEPSRPPKRFEKADDVRGGKRKRGYTTAPRIICGRRGRMRKRIRCAQSALGERAVALADSGAAVFI